jgi:hypothetical protein
MFGLIGPIIQSLFGVIDKAVEDKDAANAIKGKLQAMALAGQMKELEAATSVILAEAKGSWLQKNWRPAFMVIFMLIVANNYLFSPWFGVPMLPIPPEMWGLIKWGMGGYVVGRSVEKGIKVWKGK